MSKVEIVIPVGPGDPALDVPAAALLEKGLRNAKDQTAPVRLTCAIDVNLPEQKASLIRSIADKVELFDSHSYYRPGGIWNKIVTCWEHSDAEYVAWSGYDDLSSPDRFEKQAAMLDRTGANSCFCSNYEINGCRVTQTNNGHIDFKSHIGRHAPYMGAFLLRRKAILDSGLVEHRFKWAYYFEGLLYAYILKTGKPVVSGGTFSYHHHPGTISNTSREEREWVKAARREVGYTEAQTIADWHSIGFDAICDAVRKTL
jgi:hypothetical protein